MNIQCINLHKINLKRLLISIAIPLAAGILSTILSGDIRPIYQELEKPPFAPAPIAFPIVWGILYILLGISSYLIYQCASPLRKKALSAYGIQLFLNIFWTMIFFKFKLFLFAAIWLGLIIIAAAVMLVYFYKIKPCAAYLQIPYGLWLLFAMTLNAAIYFLN